MKLNQFKKPLFISSRNLLRLITGLLLDGNAS